MLADQTIYWLIDQSRQHLLECMVRALRFEGLFIRVISNGQSFFIRHTPYDGISFKAIGTAIPHYLHKMLLTRSHPHLVQY